MGRYFKLFNMKKYFYILVLIAITSFACKKEATLPQPVTFARVKFADPFNIFASPNGPLLKVTYQDKDIDMQTDGSIVVLPGEGNFAFFNLATGTKVLTKKLDINKDIIKTYVFFKPDPNLERVELIENTQSTEPQPAEDHIKVKIANFAQAVLGDRNIKIVFSQNDIPVDTIQTVGTDYTNGYSEMPRAFTIVRGQKRPVFMYAVSFLDENNHPVLDGNGSPIISDFYSINGKAIYTSFVRPNASGGSNLETANLFED